MIGGHQPEVWIGFTAVIVLLLVVDLGILNRRPHAFPVREAAMWSGGLVLLASAFGAFLWLREGHHRALEFATGYVVELSLSVDNLFVFILLFRYFAVPPRLQPRVLQWGILGAIAMRGVMIACGALLLKRFEFVVLLFGALLVVTGVRMFFVDQTEPIDPEKNLMLRLGRRVLPLSESFDDGRFFTRKGARLLATPLLLVLLVVEWTDLVFAIDSIPAIFAITRDPFIVYSSNIFAILGLRAIFFLLAGVMESFVYLKQGVAFILGFVGVKMVGSPWFHIPLPLSLVVILVTLVVAVWASLYRTSREAAK